jgi:hypothetical protein
VSGELSVDTSEVAGNPRATIAKMQVVRRAALAPQQPSAQDRRVSAEASRKEPEARAELAEEREEARPTDEVSPAEGDPLSLSELDAGGGSHAAHGPRSHAHHGHPYHAFNEPPGIVDIRV